jgi:DNA-dependent RNA polymerase auxiliary subunit epsilon
LAKNSEAKKLLADARYNLEFVKKAQGVHNVDYAGELLEAGSKMVKDALAKVK